MYPFIIDFYGILVFLIYVLLLLYAYRIFGESCGLEFNLELPKHERGDPEATLSHTFIFMNKTS